MDIFLSNGMHWSNWRAPDNFALDNRLGAQDLKNVLLVPDFGRYAVWCNCKHPGGCERIAPVKSGARVLVTNAETYVLQTVSTHEKIFHT